MIGASPNMLRLQADYPYVFDALERVRMDITKAERATARRCEDIREHASNAA